MTFYLLPPRGSIPLAELEGISWRRLSFLLQVGASSGAGASYMAIKDLVEESGTVEHSECLIEGTKKDAVGHFLLRLACSQDPSMRAFFIRTECALFSFRFSCMTEKELSKLGWNIRKSLRGVEGPGHCDESTDQALQLLAGLSKAASWDSLIAHYLRGSPHLHLDVPFQLVPALVGGRKVVLQRGVASVPVTRLRDVLVSLFEQLLAAGLRETSRNLPHVMADVRMRRLLKQIKAEFERRRPHHDLGHIVGSLNSEDVDSAAETFPLCMSHLHRQLRLKHRLRHEERVRYTLFLKEVGLNVHEAVKFWRQEYSQNHSNNGGCQHTWRKDGARYTYSIRHLYGLEGARINYRGHSCQAILDCAPGAGSVGGCPYAHFDQRHLQEELSISGIPPNQQAAILAQSSLGHCRQACATHYRQKVLPLLVENHTSSKTSKTFKDLLHGKETAPRRARHYRQYEQCQSACKISMNLGNQIHDKDKCERPEVTDKKDDELTKCANDNVQCAKIKCEVADFDLYNTAIKNEVCRDSRSDIVGVCGPCYVPEQGNKVSGTLGNTGVEPSLETNRVRTPQTAANQELRDPSQVTSIEDSQPPGGKRCNCWTKSDKRPGNIFHKCIGTTSATGDSSQYLSPSQKMHKKCQCEVRGDSKLFHEQHIGADKKLLAHTENSKDTAETKCAGISVAMESEYVSPEEQVRLNSSLLASAGLRGSEDSIEKLVLPGNGFCKPKDYYASFHSLLQGLKDINR